LPPEIIDPELMLIVDLGLVYGITVNETNHKIDVNLRLTSPCCPMGDIITADTKHKITANYPNIKLRSILFGRLPGQ